MIPKYAGFFWYRADQYERFKKISKDGHKLPDTHAHFVQFAEQGMQQARLAGWVPVKVDVDIDVFLAWCRATGRDVDAQSRVDYANERVGELLKAGELPG